jgi:hypothetical protein
VRCGLHGVLRRNGNLSVVPVDNLAAMNFFAAKNQDAEPVFRAGADDDDRRQSVGSNGERRSALRAFEPAATPTHQSSRASRIVSEDQ